MARSSLTRFAAVLTALGIALFEIGCAGLRTPPPQPLRLVTVMEEGDAQRRASSRLTARGLSADAAGRPVEALANYERALAVDSSNPHAYLAIARFEATDGDAEQALAFLDKAAALYEVEPGGELADAHLEGLRGVALRRLGQAENARPYLENASRLAPDAWGDGSLDAQELR